MSAAPINDGGPVFPCEWDYIGTNRAAANGMSLRDYFAERAPFTLRDSWIAANLGGTFEDWLTRVAIDGPSNRLLMAHARMSYVWADAMLSERAKATGGAA